MKTVKLSNGVEVEIPEVDVTVNTFGLLLASRIKLTHLLKKKEAKRTKMETLAIEFVNSIIFRCQVVLNTGIMPETKYYLNPKLKVVV
jgi:hypothetical protein